MKTYFAKKEEPIEKRWVLIDADGKILGRMATRIADILRGKNKPVYTPHVDTGDFVVVVNAEKVKLTGKKWDEKVYYHHSGYLGGIKAQTAKEVLAKKPEELIRHAVKGMLPKNRLGRRMIGKLKVYRGSEHPHEAQFPMPPSGRRSGESSASR
jgi:large subunit ribosomal protein L13